MTKATKHTRALTGTAMLAAVATILMYMEFPIPIMPGFIKMDISELPALIASFAYGPLSGIAVCLIKNLIKLPSTSTAAVGELFNFVMGALFVGVAGIVYKKNKTRKGAIIGAVAGALIMALVSLPYNYFVVYPAYVVMYHLPLEAIIGMYQAINPNVNGLLACLVTFNVPFTFAKGMVDALLCFLIYKPLSPILHGRKELIGQCPKTPSYISSAAAPRALLKLLIDKAGALCYYIGYKNRIATYQERLREQAL